MESISPFIFYGLAWLSFAWGHSLLARDAVKSVLKPAFGAFYRISYNGFALLHLGAIYVFGWMIFDPHIAYERPDLLLWTQGLTFGLGWIMMFWALREYDLGILSGISQIREYFNGVMAHDEEALHFNGFHQWVRHPLYSAGFLILWGRVSSDFELATAIYGSLYLWIGSIFEERHLLRVHGDPYATYKSKVPAFVPWKGRVEPKKPH